MDGTFCGTMNGIINIKIYFNIILCLCVSSLQQTWIKMFHLIPNKIFPLWTMDKKYIFLFLLVLWLSYFSSSFSVLEFICTGHRWGLRGAKECVQSPCHVTGGPHRPSHPSYAQHHSGKCGTALRWESDYIFSLFRSGCDEKPSSLIYNDTYSS